MKNIIRFSALSVALLMGGCASAPWDPLVDVQPVEMPEKKPVRATGSIFHDGAMGLALFEDRRPRNIGDVITIQFNESVSAKKSASANSGRAGSANLTMDELGEALASLGEYGFSLSGANDFDASGGAEAANEFTGTLTVQVRDVLSNGNLLVAGEKKIAINQGTEYIRFSGVVNPRNISGRNTVPSSEVADASIEYVGGGYIHEAQRMGWMQRLFLNISPF